MINRLTYYSVQAVSFQYGKTLEADNDLEIVHAMIYTEGGNPELHSTSIQTSRDIWTSQLNPYRSEECIALNRKLIEWERALLSAARRLSNRNQAVAPEELIAEMDRAQSPLLTLEDAFALFLSCKQEQSGPQIFESYNKRWMWVSQYLKRQRTPALPLVSVDAPFVQTFYYHLSQQLGAFYADQVIRLVTEVCQWTLNERE